jgi:6-phosphogluconolactonase
MNFNSCMITSMTAALALSSANVLADDNFGGYDNSGAVYTMTNSVAGNQILIFSRDSNGNLHAAGEVSTNGLGVGGGLDALGSQHSLVLTRDEQWLVAVNAGSNEISVMRVNPNGLEFVSKVSSGGKMPVSVAVRQNVVYVLNGGASPNVTGFALGFDGKLTPLPNSTRSLGASAFGEIGFDERGQTMLVTDKGNSKIIAFAIDGNGMLGASPVTSPSSGSTPFGFTFDWRDHLLVVEAGADAVSSYSINSNGSLQSISASIVDGQKASCWIATDGWRYAYTANPGSQTISSFTVNKSTGAVALLNASASPGAVTAPLDIATSRDGRFLYALDAGSLQIDAFRIEANGGLSNLGPVNGGFAIYAQGIAVR